VVRVVGCEAIGQNAGVSARWELRLATSDTRIGVLLLILMNLLYLLYLLQLLRVALRQLLIRRRLIESVCLTRTLLIVMRLDVGLWRWGRRLLGLVLLPRLLMQVGQVCLLRLLWLLLLLLQMMRLLVRRVVVGRWIRAVIYVYLSNCPGIARGVSLSVCLSVYVCLRLQLLRGKIPVRIAAES
jgi:hypothetical protein